MSFTLPPLSMDSPALHHPALVAQVADQIGHQVQQLLLATLARARPLVPPAALPSAPAARMRLSPRECEVLQRIAAGDSNKMIARTLDLSPHTVKRHVANLLDKLGVASRGQAAAWYLARPQHRPGELAAAGRQMG